MTKYIKNNQFLLAGKVLDNSNSLSKEKNTCFKEKYFYDKNKENSEDNMPLEISDAELLDMDPELLLSLQKYLKDRRAQHPQVPLKEDATSALVANTSSKTTISEGTELVTIKSWDISSAANATLDEVEGPDGLYLGSRVTQDGRTYIARNWKITEQLKKFILIAIDVGFQKLWRTNHPMDSYLLGNENYLMGCHHISCSRTHDSPWVFALGAESLSNVGGRQMIKEVTFNKIYGDMIQRALSEKGGRDMYLHNGRIQPGHFKVQRGGGRNFTIHPDDFETILPYLAKSIT